MRVAVLDFSESMLAIGFPNGTLRADGETVRVLMPLLFLAQVIVRVRIRVI